MRRDDRTCRESIFQGLRFDTCGQTTVVSSEELQAATANADVTWVLIGQEGVYSPKEEHKTKGRHVVVIVAIAAVVVVIVTLMTALFFLNFRFA